MLGIKLTALLSDMKSSFDDIEGLALSTTDGLVLASHSINCVETRFATLLEIGVQTAKSMAIGKVEQLLIHGKEGLIVLLHADSDAVLAILAKPQAQVELICTKARHIANEAAHIISTHEYHL